jgi:hypothetical protein
MVLKFCGFTRDFVDVAARVPDARNGCPLQGDRDTPPQYELQTHFCFRFSIFFSVPLSESWTLLLQVSFKYRWSKERCVRLCIAALAQPSGSFCSCEDAPHDFFASFMQKPLSKHFKASILQFRIDFPFISCGICFAFGALSGVYFSISIHRVSLKVHFTFIE